MDNKTMTENDSRAMRDVTWIEKERLALLDYLASTPKDQQSFQGWFQYAYVVRGLPIFEGCLSEEIFEEIMAAHVDQVQPKRRGRPRPEDKAMTQQEAQAQEEERIKNMRESISQMPKYKEAVGRGWIVDFNWTNTAPYTFKTWLTKSGIVQKESGPGSRWSWKSVDRVFTWKGGEPLTKEKIKCMK